MLLKKYVCAALILLPLASPAVEKSLYCKGQGRAELIIDRDSISISTQGLGGKDGVTDFVDMKAESLSAQWAGNYSDYLQVPIREGTVYSGKIKTEGPFIPAQIYVLRTDKDTRGRIQEILLVSLAGNPPTPIGVDVECRK